MSSATGVRKTRATNILLTPIATVNVDNSSNIEQLHKNLQSSNDFINVYNQCYQIENLRTSLFDTLCNILSDSEKIDIKVLLFIIDCFIANHEYQITDIQFKQNILPFIKRILSLNDDNKDLITSIIKFLIDIIEHRLNLLVTTLTEWLSCVLHFIVTRITATSYIVYGDLVIDLLKKIVTSFTPLPKEIVDVLGRSPSSIISTNFLTELKSWVKHIDDTKLALFAIHLWEPLAALLSRLLTRGHTKGNEMLAVMQDAFVVPNYSIRGSAFSAWASFMSHIYEFDLKQNPDDQHQKQLYNRLLKLFLTPFIPDYTSKSKSASISKCRAWSVLISAYPTHIDDVILPFLSFSFGNHTSCKTNSNTSTWWLECREIGAQSLHQLLNDNVNGENLIKSAADQILNYLFDLITDKILEYTINQTNDIEKSIWLTSWNAYLIHLRNLFTSNNSINENQHLVINTCLLTRFENLWIDSRLGTKYLLKLLNSFEQTSFPIAIETVLRDSSTRTKTLSATQNSEPQQDKLSSLADQYLHMMLEHAIRFNDENEIFDESYLHIITYLIDTLSKISDDHFCSQTRSLLLKCSVELNLQPLKIPHLFWHIWLRCSTYLINILNRTRSFEINNQRQETTIELLLRPFSFADHQCLDYSYGILWTQLFKALCRLFTLDGKSLINLYIELLRHGPIFQQAINDKTNQRVFGFILSSIKSLLKIFSEIDLTIISKRLLPSVSSIALCYTQLTIIINSILQRLLLDNEYNSQWLSISNCLIKSNKISTNEQSKSFVLTFIRDLIVDLFQTCKTCTQFEIVLTNLTNLNSYLNSYEQSNQIALGLSPISTSKQQQQQTDNIILNKFISTLHHVFESSNATSLLKVSYSLLINGFQHSKTIIRNKMRKCWNETFGRVTFLTYPNELRIFLRELKDKEHLLLPCFLADHDNSNTAGSGIMPNTTDESQLSQQIDIATPFMVPTHTILKQNQSSPARIRSPCKSIQHDKSEPVFAPITNNINYDDESESPVIISKRIPSSSTCLTEKQKEKLRTRQSIPLICDDNSNTQSLSSYTIDTPTVENMIATYSLRSTSNSSKQSTIGNGLSLFKQAESNSSFSNQSSQENANTTVESSSSSPVEEPSSTSSSSSSSSSSTTLASSSTIIDSENVPVQNEDNNNSNNNEEEFPEESSISKKLRRSRRPSTSARKSLTNNTRKKRSVPLSDEVVATISSAIVTESTITAITSTSSSLSPKQETNDDSIKGRPLKSILKRLSPSKPRQDHTRRVAFHDQVKVLLFASPLRRDSSVQQQQQKKKSPSHDDNRISSSILTRRSSGLHNKPRPSKLFNLNDKTTPELSTNSNTIVSTQNKLSNPIFPALVNCDKPLDSLIHVVCGGVCPTNVINYFHSIKMMTVGDVARSTAEQIEIYPIPPPKLANILKAFSLYQERLINSPSLSPIIGNNTESLAPIASTSEEPIAISDGTFTKEVSSLPNNGTPIVNDPHNRLYDVDTLIDSLDYERLYLNDNKEFDDESIPSSTNQIDFIRTRRKIALANRDDEMSPQKRRLSATLQDESDVNNETHDEQSSSKKQTIENVTLGDRLQMAADIYKSNGRLPFDDAYIELVRQLFNNSSLTHLEKLHLKSLFLDN